MANKLYSVNNLLTKNIEQLADGISFDLALKACMNPCIRAVPLNMNVFPGFIHDMFNWMKTRKTFQNLVDKVGLSSTKCL